MFPTGDCGRSGRGVGRAYRGGRGRPAQKDMMRRPSGAGLLRPAPPGGRIILDDPCGSEGIRRANAVSAAILTMGLVLSFEGSVEVCGRGGGDAGDEGGDGACP